MNKQLVLYSLGLCLSVSVFSQSPQATEVWTPVPVVVSPGASPQSPPSDAIVLFDGKDLYGWTNKKRSLLNGQLPME